MILTYIECYVWKNKVKWRLSNAHHESLTFQYVPKMPIRSSKTQCKGARMEPS